MEEEIKELRVQIDGLAQLTNDVKHDHVSPRNAKEIEKTTDSLYLAKAWLGKVLQEIGAVNPYKSGYKTKEDIQPTSEVAKNLTVNVDGGWQEMNHIEKVDYLRTEIESLIQSECLYVMSNTRLEALARGNTYQHLCEAKFQLGFELQRIKEEK